MTQKQIEELQRLCDSCGDKYVRIDTCVKGVKNKIFFNKPIIIHPPYVRDIAIGSDKVLIIATVRIKTEPRRFYEEQTFTLKNQDALFLEEGMRIYKTPFSAKAIKRIINNMFNDKLK